MLDAPDQAAEIGVQHLEVCHFHFPRTDDEYLARFRERLDRAGVGLLAVLIDAGDLTATNPDVRRQEIEDIKEWIDVAARAGARRVRVIAGDASADSSGDAVRLSAEGLSELTEYARGRSVEVITENWRRLATAPDDLLAILDAAPDVGLCADFGNYSGPEKYDDLAKILPRAWSIHAKAQYPEAGRMDEGDLRRCLELAQESGFDGQYVLIFDGPGDEVESLKEIARVVQEYSPVRA